jgi:ABC-type Fe3+-hydroxamate transport system substrate-binding protein
MTSARFVTCWRSLVHGVLLCLAMLPLWAAAAQQSAAMPAAPKRVVVLEYMLAESLLALDIVPVGMSDANMYPDWNGYRADLLADVVNVGTRQQPSLEAIAMLKPDLILGFSNRHAPLFGALDRIAPTVLYDFDLDANGGTHLDLTFWIFDHIAALTGRTRKARKIRREVEAALAVDRGRIADAGLTGRQVTVLQDLGLQDTYWSFTGNSMFAGIGRRTGLRIWPPEPTRDGAAYANSEDLLSLAHTDIVMMSYTDEASLESKLTSPIWRHVPAMKNRRIAFLPRNLWYFGGPVSVIRLSNHLTGALITLPPVGTGD